MINLNIEVSEEPGGYFFAQTSDGEFFGQGNTKDEAMANCIKSLHWTIEEHLKIYGNLNHLPLGGAVFNRKNV